MISVLFVIAVTGAAFRIAALQRRVQALQADVIRDPLTGAFNRRHLQTTLAVAIERQQRSGERASLLLFDLDRFKDINDALGHAEGDRVLKAVVALIGQRLRRLDALFRVGGEEFVLLLSGAGFTDAVSIAEELRTLVQDAGLGRGHAVSISIGVAELVPEQSVDEWLEGADAALYRAKRAGRNRVAGRYALPTYRSPLPASRLPLSISNR
jgi:diguanylate cyclase (GGDEF)-like protein